MNTRRIQQHESRKVSPSFQALMVGAGVLSFLGFYDKADDALVYASKGALSITGYQEGGIQDGVVETPPQVDVLVANDQAIPSEPAPEQSDAAPTDLAMPDDCLGGTYDSWYFNPEADTIIDSIEYEQEKIDFLKFSIRAVCQTMKEGALINPYVAFVQSSLESNNGTDTLAPYNNFFGHKYHPGADYKVEDVMTHEDRGNGLEPEPEDFAGYSSISGSYWAYADMLGRLDYYQSLKNPECRYDNDKTIDELLHDTNPQNCEITLRQGQKDVKSYATAKNYREVLYNRADYIKADELITRP